MFSSSGKITGAGLVFLLCAIAAACGGSESGVTESSSSSASGGADAADIRLISADEASDFLANDASDDLVVLDVRTPEEFEDGHLADATMIDFYEADFVNRIADLDRDAEYLVYCHSGNRSGQTVAMMKELGFTNVLDVDGGITSWVGSGHPVQTGAN